MRVKFRVSLDTPTSEVLVIERLIDDYDLKDMTEQAKKEYIEGEARDWAYKHVKVEVEY